MTNSTDDTGAPTAPRVKLSSLRADEALERNGDWKDAIGIPGVSFKVRSINYPPYTIARDFLMQRLRRKAGGKPIKQDVLLPELGRLYAEHILLDWKGFDEAYTPELAMKTLTDPQYRELVSAIESLASQVGESEIEFIEDTIKN